MNVAAIDAQIHKIELKFSWNIKARQAFYKLVATFVRDGVPIFDTIVEIDERLRARKDARQQITGSLLKDMRGKSGESLRFGQAMKAWAPSIEVIAIEAGEFTGDLPGGLQMAIRLTDVKQRVVKTIRSQLIEPTGLIVAFVVFLVSLKSIVLPGLAEVLPREKWTGISVWLGFVADNVGPIVGMISSTLLGVFASFLVTKDIWVGPGRQWVETWIFPWTLHRQISGAIMLTCFAALLRANTPAIDILLKLRSNGSDWERYHLDVMRKRMRNGQAEGEAISTPLFDEETRWLISVYGKRTAFADSLEGLSHEVIEQMLARVTAVTSILGILAKVAVGGMIVFVVFSFMQISMDARSLASG